MNVSEWEVVGIAKFASKKDASRIFYAVSCTRTNDSLVRGSTECCRKVVSARGIDRGVDIGSFVRFLGQQNGSDFVACVQRVDISHDDFDDIPF